MHQKVSD